MGITQPDNVIDLRFLLFFRQRIPKENNKIDGIHLDISTQLYGAPCNTGRIFVDIQVGRLLDKASGRPCGIQLMLYQNISIGNAEILHQYFFCVVGNQSNVHAYNPSCNYHMMFAVQC